MNEFSIDELAKAQISFYFSLSDIREPVAMLCDGADIGHLYDEYILALREGSKTKHELDAMARKRFEEVKTQLPPHLLMIHPCESSDFKKEDLCDINGITFVLDSNLIDALRGYCLTFQNDRFLLASSDNMATSLLSVMRSWSMKW